LSIIAAAVLVSPVLAFLMAIAVEILGVEPVGFRSAMLPRNGHTRGMDHVRLYPTCLEPARQPEAVPARFEGQRNPRDRLIYLRPVG
jgi:hypothetical protein